MTALIILNTVMDQSSLRVARFELILHRRSRGTRFHAIQTPLAIRSPQRNTIPVSSPVSMIKAPVRVTASRLEFGRAHRNVTAAQ